MDINVFEKKPIKMNCCQLVLDYINELKKHQSMYVLGKCISSGAYIRIEIVVEGSAWPQLEMMRLRLLSGPG